MAGRSLTPSHPHGAGAHQTMGANHKVSPSETLVVPRSVKANLSSKIRNEHVDQAELLRAAKDAVHHRRVRWHRASPAPCTCLTTTGRLARPSRGSAGRLHEVQGACSDTSGNVYFANTGSRRSTNTPTAVRSSRRSPDPGQFPVGCAFDKSSGQPRDHEHHRHERRPWQRLDCQRRRASEHVLPVQHGRVYFGGYEGKYGHAVDLAAPIRRASSSTTRLAADRSRTSASTAPASASRARLRGRPRPSG